jgi:hypothetical protein
MIRNDIYTYIKQVLVCDHSPVAYTQLYTRQNSYYDLDIT